MPVGVVVVLVLALAAFILVKAILRAKVRGQYADEMSARREMAKHDASSRPVLQPSWATNQDKMETFQLSLTQLAKTRRIPFTWVMRVFMEGALRDTMFTLVAHMERGGSSFTEQQLSAFNFIADTWGRLSSDQKRQLVALAEASVES